MRRADGWPPWHGGAAGHGVQPAPQACASSNISPTLTHLAHSTSNLLTLLQQKSQESSHFFALKILIPDNGGGAAVLSAHLGVKLDGPDLRWRRLERGGSPPSRRRRRGRSCRATLLRRERPWGGPGRRGRRPPSVWPLAGAAPQRGGERQHKMDRESRRRRKGPGEGDASSASRQTTRVTALIWIQRWGIGRRLRWAQRAEISDGYTRRVQAPRCVKNNGYLAETSPSC